ncbi:MAG3090 family protein [Mycoplasmopsis felifaucium]|uniref:MAG3090 family protein n=1 Tax=Mycoplasmopsis felifaucium TaxID=35768 RepID=UPI0004858DAB|nr:hypothetical protein [Mycoplasmopsis felifaucium]
MRKIAIIRDANATYPWVLKNLKMTYAIASFVSISDALNWYITYKIESLISLYDEKKTLVGQIAYINQDDEWLLMASSSGFEKKIDYLALCQMFNIDPISHLKKETDEELKNINKDLIYEYLNDPKTYFIDKYDTIKKPSADDYLNNEARSKIFELQIKNSVNKDDFTRTHQFANTANIFTGESVILSNTIDVKTPKVAELKKDVENKLCDSTIVMGAENIQDKTTIAESTKSMQAESEFFALNNDGSDSSVKNDPYNVYNDNDISTVRLDKLSNRKGAKAGKIFALVLLTILLLAGILMLVWYCLEVFQIINWVSWM